jgi:para-nitrobenzyl esterase
MGRFKRLTACAMLVAGMATGSSAQPLRAPMAQVTGGTVQGAIEQDDAVFKGIPYAAAPVGDLRWRDPQPVKSWSGVRQAVDYGSGCMQANAGYNKRVADQASEDCLYLNVWTPRWPAAQAKMPVMVWMHGGGNVTGSAIGGGGIEPPFTGPALTRHGVVLVTINYRLGIFGFIGHPELSAESVHHASGEYGLLDQVAALQWVHDNIARFGGDPANVTLFGQSAGAQDTTLLVSSPLARGLIAKAIVESGSPMIGDKRLQSPAQTEQLGVVLAGMMKAPATGQIAYLRSLPAAQLLAAVPDFKTALATQHLIMDAGMDGYVVPEFSPSVYRAGREAPIPMIIGSNGRDLPTYRAAADTPDAIAAAVKTRISDAYAKYPDLALRAQKAYGLDGGPAAIDYPPYGPLDLQFGADQGFRCEATVETNWHSNIAPTYEYEFNAGNAAHPPKHSGELDFIFGYLRDQASDPMLVKLADQMQRYWTNFAKTGNPNGPGLPAWPRFDGAARAYLELGNQGPSSKVNLRGTICSIYAEKLSKDLDARR